MTANLSNIVVTTPIKSVGQTAAPAALSGGMGLFAGGVGDAGLNFMDLIFARMAAETAAGTGQTGADGKKSQGSPLATLDLLLHKVTGQKKAEDVTADVILGMETCQNCTGPLALSGDILLSEGDTAEELLTAATDSGATQDGSSLKDILAGRADKDKGGKFLDFLNSLLAGIPAENRPLVTPIGTNEAQSLAADASLKTSVTADGSSPALIATGLTLEKITQFLDDVIKRTQQGESFFIGLAKIMPSQSQQEAILMPRGFLLTPQQAKEGSGIAPAPDSAGDTIAAALNELTAGEDSAAGKKDPGFDNILKILEQAQKPQVVKGSASNNLFIAPSNEPSAPAKAGAGAGLKPVQTNIIPAQGMDFNAALSDQVYPDGLDWTQLSVTAGHGGPLTLSGPAMMTSLVNNAGQAIYPHPATQMIATSITRAAADGQSKNITVKLDPPDLGRVEIQIEFGEKMKTLKAHIIAEKPETYLMLQRDAHHLQRALNDSGLDAGGNSLSFELAQHGSMSDQGRDGNGSGGNSGGGSTGGEQAESEVIESTMTWRVDPDTGMTSYDIWA